MNCEVELDLVWTKDRVLIELLNSKTGVDFKVTSTKLYVPVVTFSINDNIKFLGNLKEGFKRRISRNKNGSVKRTQPKNKNLDYMIVHIGIITVCLLFH